MLFKIRSFRGCISADINLTNLTLISGINGAGKSSVREAIGSVLTGQVMLYDIPKNRAQELITHGAKHGMVTVDSVNGSASVTWPSAEYSTENTPPTSTAIAVGLDNIMAWKDKERFQFLSDLLDAYPDQAMLAESLKDIVPAAHVTSLWKSIQEIGWDGTHQLAKEKGTKLKGAWEQVTKEKYGKNKADNWYPFTWSADIEGKTEEELLDEVDTAQEWVNAGITDKAVEKAMGEKELADLKMKSSLVSDLKETLDKRKKEHDAAVASYDKACDEYDAAKSNIISDMVEACPYCDKALKIVQGHIAKADTVDQKAIEESKSVAEKAKQKVDAEGAIVKQSLAYLEDISSRHREATDAEKKLAAYTPPVDIPSKSDADIETARRRLTAAQNNLEALKSKTEADGIAAKIRVNESVVSMLAPDGLRAKKLQDTLAEVNSALGGMCVEAGYPSVGFDSDCGVWYDGDTPYFLCSESEQMRMRFVLQTYIAGIQNAGVLIFDGADKLDGKGRNGLFAMAQGSGIPSIICMTMKKDDYKTLSEKFTSSGYDAYWLEKGLIA